MFLRADGEVQTQELLDVIDRLKEGGIERVGIVALQRAGTLMDAVTADPVGSRAAKSDGLAARCLGASVAGARRR